MVFFNYATMQMAAKIVYYGPGLCGKTTNLHHIYGRTSPGSRGEMVSLETETDRTLFFDLLPLDVGVIGGFKTRVQLYTVPGQVFYNTTRKLVLKGVDGIVFVADSQRAMKDANVESVNNLRTNLAEISLKMEDLPLVFQYNKRDLSNILTVEELAQSLNPHGTYESYEACAVLGQGVFETLKAISRLTLRSLKKRMLGDDRPTSLSPGIAAVTGPSIFASDAVPARVAPAPEPVPAPAPPPPPPPPVQERGTLEARPVPAQTDERPPSLSPAIPPPPDVHAVEQFDAADAETVNEFEEALNSLDAPLPDVEIEAAEGEQEPLEIGDISFAETPGEAGEPEKVAEAEVKHVRVRTNIDILSELEKLRKNATSAPAPEKPGKRIAPGISIDDLLANSLNHRKEVNRIFELQVPRRELAEGHQVTVGLRLEDKERKLIGEEKTFSIELNARQDIEKLLLSLKFHIFGK
jgi:signal recognition particle receptor subunit beta